MIGQLLDRIAQRLSPPCPFKKHGCHRTWYEGKRGRCWASDCPIRPLDRERSKGDRLIGIVDWDYLDAENNVKRR